MENRLLLQGSKFDNNFAVYYDNLDKDSGVRKAGKTRLTMV